MVDSSPMLDRAILYPLDRPAVQGPYNAVHRGDYGNYLKAWAGSSIHQADLHVTAPSLGGSTEQQYSRPGHGRLCCGAAGAKFWGRVD